MSCALQRVPNPNHDSNKRPDVRADRASNAVPAAATVRSGNAAVVRHYPECPAHGGCQHHVGVSCALQRVPDNHDDDSYKRSNIGADRASNAMRAAATVRSGNAAVVRHYPECPAHGGHQHHIGVPCALQRVPNHNTTPHVLHANASLWMPTVCRFATGHVPRQHPRARRKWPRFVPKHVRDSPWRHVFLHVSALRAEVISLLVTAVTQLLSLVCA